jgi:hypothetical protein
MKRKKVCFTFQHLGALVGEAECRTREQHSTAGLPRAVDVDTKFLFP